MTGARYTPSPMYAVIRSGGKQERVGEGERIRVERLGVAPGEEVSLEPVLVVGDDGEVRATPDELAEVTVTARVVGEELGPKIDAMTYKSKTNQRRRWGHRQRYSIVEILSIGAPARPAVTRDEGARASDEEAT